jgi:hypothetical protein
MIKLQALNSSKLSIVDLGGLSNETIIAGTAAGGALGPLGTASLGVLATADSKFRAKLITAKGSPITVQIHDFDVHRDDDFSEIWRTANTASKSSNAANAAAGHTLVTFLYPYRNVAVEPLMSETSTLNFLQTRYSADQAVQNAASVLQLGAVFASLFSANEQVSILWNARTLEDAGKSGPSPSSLRSDLENSYDGFCNVVIQTLRLQPSTALENLFTAMNEIRIKYVRLLPVRLTGSNTSADAIPEQEYTGKAVTPIPRVFFKSANGETKELQFSEDFFVTYRNNTEVGEATVVIHGKGKYCGSHNSTFHIARA